MAFFFASLFYYLLEKVMNMGYLENAYFNEIAADVYMVSMAFLMTCVLLISLKDLRWETQSIYFFYFSALNQDRAVNFLRLRTVMIEGVQRFALQHEDLQKAIRKLMAEHAVYGTAFKSLVIEDRVEQLTLERDTRCLREYRKSFEDPRINPLSKWLMPSEVKSLLAFERRLDDLRHREQSANNTARRPSGYGFACFSNFEAVAKFKKYGKRWGY